MRSCCADCCPAGHTVRRRVAHARTPGTLPGMPMPRMTPPSDHLDLFARRIAVEVDQHLDPAAHQIGAAATDDDTADLAFVAVPVGVDPAAALDQVFAGRPKRVALVTTIGWAPDGVSPSALAWAIVAVQSGRPMLCALRRVVEDLHWTKIAPEGLPWVLLSSGAGLRAMLDHRVPLRLKWGTDPRLFRSPDEEPTPPSDERGEL